MIRWRTLNNGDNIEEESNAEIQVEHLLETFQMALKIHQRGERVDAKAKYELILANDVMTEEDTEEQTKGDALHSSSLVLLRFLVFKNYAAIIEEESKLPSCTKDERDTLLTKAMDYYIKALMIDPSERSLWQRIGAIADSLGNLRLARSSFEKGLCADPTNLLHQSSMQVPSITGLTTRQHDEKTTQLLSINGNLSPIQWHCLEGLCEVLYKIGDYDLCNLYLKSGLHRFPSWPFGKCLVVKINSTVTNDDNTHPTSPHHYDTADTQHDQPIIMHIASPGWDSLISVLLDQYKQMYTKKKGDTENNQKQNTGAGRARMLMNRAVQIHIDSIDDSTTSNTEDTEMTQADTSITKIADDTTSTQIQQQPKLNSSETHNDTIDTTNSTDNMQIDSLSTVADTTITTKMHSSENHSFGTTAPTQQQVTEGPSTSSPSSTIPQQNEQQATDGPNISNPSTKYQQNGPQSTEDPPTKSPPAIIHQENHQQATNDPSTLNSLVTLQQSDKLATHAQDNIVDLTLLDDDNVYCTSKRKHDDENDNDDGENGDFKRQRNDQVDKDDDDGDGDGDDEHEYEEKRTSLRASQRQKEKVESEEVFRKKMFTEETELSDMTQEVFDTFGIKNDFSRGTPWFRPMELDIESSVLESFWEYFDAKVSELGVDFTWNFDNMKAKDDLFSPTYSKKHQFVKFETIVPSSSLSSTNTDSTAIRQFIGSLNETNSGTGDSLCQTIITILRRELEQTGYMDDKTVSLAIDAVETLGQEMVNAILINDCQDLWIQTNSYVERIQLLTSLSEKVVDRLISSILREQSSSGPSLSSKQRSLVEKQNKLIKQNQERCNYWVDLIGDTLIHDTMNSFGPSFFDDNGNPDELDQWIKKKKLLLRYWLLKGKLALCENNVDKAVDWYRKCERLFENINNGELDMTLGCIYDPIVNLSTIKSKMQLMEWDKYFASSKSKLDADDYDGALSQLETLMSRQTKSDQVTNMHNAFPVTTMLATCYMKTDRYVDAWKCYADALVTLIQKLVLYGGGCITNNSTLSKSDDMEFFRLLCSVDTVIDALVRLLLDTDYQDWLPKSLDTQFLDSLIILLRTTIIYTFRHPDFIPLVNNFAIPDVTPHAPSKKTKTNSYNSVTAKSWVVISTLAQHQIRQNKGGNLAALANLLKSVHDELGEREVCGIAKGIFIQHVVKLLCDVAVNEHRRGIYQCYHCLYGVHLVADSELIEEHFAVHGTLDGKAAERLYSLVIDDVLVKIDRNLPLKNDLKDAIETVSALFEDLPDDNLYIQRNRRIIKNYLERPVNIDQTIKSMLGQCDLPIDATSTNSPSLSVVYGHMFFIRGKTLRQHIKNRPKGSSDRTMVDLEEALEQFQHHVVVHPDDHQGWYELGTTLMQLAEEELTWSAVNIITHHDLIIDYQKQAFHCFMKTWQLSSYGYRLKKEQLFGFFSSFGSLIYGMTCAPMEMASFGWNQPSKTLDENGNLHDIQPRKPAPILAYRLSLEFYSRALNYKSQDQSNWRTLLAIGKCFKNLNRPPKEVLGWYIKSIRQCQDLGSGNVPLDPTYKLYAALLKYLYRGLIEPTDVILYLNQIYLAPNTNQQPTTTASTTSTPLSRAAEDSSSMTGIIDLTANDDDDSYTPQQVPKSVGKMEAFDLIFEKLTELRKRDKKHVYHRPLYKIAWMHYKIYNDAQKAKTEILQLFTLKQTNKGLLSIWRPEYERPGKHFVFIKQYVTFLIDLATETRDLETLKNMCRKLKRAGTTLLKEEEEFKAALSAYIKVLQMETLLPHQGSAKRQQIIMGPLDKDDFDTMCKNLTNELVSSADPNPNIVAILQDLVDIRRQAFGYVPTENLDTAIQECFAILLFERTNVQTLLAQDSQTTSTMAAALSTISLSPNSSASATQNMDGTINRPDSHKIETPSEATAMDTSEDVDREASTTIANESNQDGGNQQGIEGSILSLRARALVTCLYGNVRT